MFHNTMFQSLASRIKDGRCFLKLSHFFSNRKARTLKNNDQKCRSMRNKEDVGGLFQIMNRAHHQVIVFFLNFHKKNFYSGLLWNKCIYHFIAEYLILVFFHWIPPLYKFVYIFTFTWLVNIGHFLAGLTVAGLKKKWKKTNIRYLANDKFISE